MERLACRYDAGLLGDVFTSGEQEAGHDDLARCFAVKEATLKAIGTGVRSGVSFRDVEVALGDDGVADVGLTAPLAAVLERYELDARTFVEEGWASAVVLLSPRRLACTCGTC
jgi:holo-[acyl-carrier-protein] synthase